MLDLVIDLIKTDLAALAFVDKAGGIVCVQKIKTKDKVKSLPAYLVNSADPCEGGDYDIMILEGNACVIYFEHVSTQTKVKDQYFHQRSNVQLVCLMNLKKINPSNPSLVKLNILKQVKLTYPDLPYLKNIAVCYTNETAKKRAYFSKYSFDEPELQPFMYPYDFFVLNFDINFTGVPSCVPIVEKVDNPC